MRRPADLSAHHTPDRVTLHRGNGKAGSILVGFRRFLLISLGLRAVAKIVRVCADEIVERDLDTVLQKSQAGHGRHDPHGLPAFLAAHHQIVEYATVFDGLTIGVEESEPESGAVVAPGVQAILFVAEGEVIQQPALLQQACDPQIDR